MNRKILAGSVFAAALSFGAAHAATLTLNTGGSSLAAPTYIAMMQKFNATLFNYEAVGSGAGQKAFLGNNITYFEPLSASNPNGYAVGTLTYGTVVGTQVDVGASDAFLSSSQVTSTGGYTESSVDGPLIQIPTIATPITFAYNEAGEKSTLTLTDAQECGVLSGKINDWHTLVPAIKAGTTIQVVFRSDSSGTTFLTTQHLNAVCNSSNSSFPTYPVPVTKYFVSSTPSNNPVFATAPADFTGESGSANVATQLVATANSIGYLSPDYTSIAPKSANTTTLKVASLVNASNGVAYTPSVANTETGLANPGAGASDTTPPTTLATAMNPLNWVPAIPVTTKGYPIVGYTTIELSSCYANKTAGTDLINFLIDTYKNSAYTTIITNNGFAPLTNTAAAPFATSIYNIFLTNTANYNLNVDNTTTCASYAGR
jgi:ABC-type phosphate transport system substrate-binding protein